MGMLDDLLGAALGEQGLGGHAAAPGSSGGLPAGLGGGAVAALLPVLLSMLSQRGGGGGGGNAAGGLGGLLGQVLGGGAGGGAGGLGGLLAQLERSGLGAQAQSWVGTGQNQPVSPEALGRVFGADGLADIARRAGLAPEQASAGLAQLLPAVVDHVTPGGRMPAGDELDGMLAGLVKRLGG